MDRRRQTTCMAAAKRRPLGNIRNMVQTVTDRVLRSRKKPKKVEMNSGDGTGDMMEYLLEKERRQFVDERRGTVSKENRSRLVEYLIQLRHLLPLQQETLELAVGLVDRSLSLVTQIRPQLQYLGLAALVVASKYEETEFWAEDLLLTADVDLKMVLEWEQRLLQEVGFAVDLVVPSHFFSPENHSEKINKLAVYIIDITLYSGIRLLPSQLAATALALSCELCDSPLDQQTVSSSLSDLAHAVLEVEMRKSQKKLSMTTGYEESGGKMTEKMMTRLEEICL